MHPGLEKTRIKVGSLLNITWSLGLVHKGGFKLELLREGQPPLLLVPGSESWEEGSKVKQSHRVTVPDITCENCSFRIQKKVEEWGEGYALRSCADVEIVSREEYTEDCSGHGYIDPNDASRTSCICQRLYHGDKCQYMSSCNSDEDCNGPKGQGQCKELDTTTFPDR